MEGNLIVDSVEKFELMFKNVKKAQAEFKTHCYYFCCGICSLSSCSWCWKYC